MAEIISHLGFVIRKLLLTGDSNKDSEPTAKDKAREAFLRVHART
jgi:hypothetical protein